MPYIVYGHVRGLVSQHRTHRGAIKALSADVRGCKSLGGGAYSDAQVYQWTDRYGWYRLVEDVSE